MVKDECSGEIMGEFVALRAKSYATKMDNNEESKKCKGISKTVTKNDIAFRGLQKCVVQPNDSNAENERYPKLQA